MLGACTLLLHEHAVVSGRPIQTASAHADTDLEAEVELSKEHQDRVRAEQAAAAQREAELQTREAAREAQKQAEAAAAHAALQERAAAQQVRDPHPYYRLHDKAGGVISASDLILHMMPDAGFGSARSSPSWSCALC